LIDIHRALGSNIQSDALSALAERPDDLAGFWAAITPAIERSFITCAADEVRRTADNFIKDHVALPDYLSWLASSGYDREDSRQLRYVIEAFHHLEPLFAILAAAGAKWARSGSLGSWLVPRHEGHSDTPIIFGGAIDFATDTHGIHTTGPRREYPETLSHPLARALAVWPGYIDKVLSDLESTAPSQEPQEAIVVLRSTVDLLTPRLPVAAATPAPRRSLLADRLKLCLEASLEAIIIACAVRRSFAKGEIAARSRRIRATAP
jgi:hypothetical protein